MPSLQFPKASLGDRFLASVVDSILVAVLVFVAALAFVMLQRSFGALSLLVAGPIFLYALFYLFTKDGRPGGKSIGKGLFGLKVVKIDTGEPIGRGDSAIRALVLQVTNLVPFGGLVEPIFVLVAKDGRRLGDLAAGTQVVDDTFTFPEE